MTELQKLEQKTNQGFRQGFSLSCELFNFCLEKLRNININHETGWIDYLHCKTYVEDLSHNVPPMIQV